MAFTQKILMKFALTKLFFLDISDTEFYGNLTKNVDNTGKILFTVLSTVVNCTDFHETRISSMAFRADQFLQNSTHTYKHGK
jgi:hypothetical protein